MSDLIEVPDEHLTRAIERELRTGEEFHKANAKYRERDIHQDVKDQKRTVKGLGRLVAAIDPWTFFKIRENYGEESVHDKGFIRDYQKRFPELCPNKL